MGLKTVREISYARSRGILKLHPSHNGPKYLMRDEIAILKNNYVSCQPYFPQEEKRKRYESLIRGSLGENRVKEIKRTPTMIPQEVQKPNPNTLNQSALKENMTNSLSFLFVERAKSWTLETSLDEVIRCKNSVSPEQPDKKQDLNRYLVLPKGKKETLVQDPQRGGYISVI